MSNKIKKAVSLYSYSQQWIEQDDFGFEEMFKHLHSLGIHTLEIVGSQMFSQYPNIPETEVQELKRLMEKYDMEFYCYDGYTDHGKKPGHDLTEEEILHEVTFDIMSAKLLGCKIMKSQLPAKFLHRVLPIAEMYDMKISVELHAPETPSSEYTQEFVRVLRELNSPYLGLCPDFGMFIVKPNEILLKKYRDQGISEEILNFIIDNRFNGYDEDSMWKKVQSLGGCEKEHLAVSEMFGFLSWSKEADLIGLENILPYCNYFHGKFYHINEKFEETTIPYRKILSMISESDFEGYIATEYEGHTFRLNDALEQIERHIKMESEILDKLNK